MPHIAIERQDGGLTILNVLDPEADVAAEVIKWEQSWGSPAVGWHFILAEDLPASRRFRNAWRFAGGRPTVHLGAARALRRAELLAERDARLERARARVQEAQEDGDNARAAALRLRARNLRQLETQLDADLAGVADAASLESYQPAAFGTPD